MAEHLLKSILSYFPTKEDFRLGRLVIATALPKEAYVVILLKAWNRVMSLEEVWLSKIPRFVFVDSADRPSLHKGYLEAVRKDPERFRYSRINLQRSMLAEYSGLLPVPFAPHPKVVACARAQANQPPPRRDLDVVFMGSLGRRRYGRSGLLRRLSKACKALQLSSHISEGGRPPEEYWNILQRGRIGYSPYGSGLRCWREWETLLAGGMLLVDDRVSRHGLIAPDLEPGVDCLEVQGDMQAFLPGLMQDPGRILDVAGVGHDRALRYCMRPALDLPTRYARIYAIEDSPAMIHSNADLEHREFQAGIEVLPVFP